MLPGIIPSMIAGATFPIVAGVATTQTTAATSHPINLPTHSPGDLLLAFIVGPNATGVPAGWTMLDTITAMYRIATGSDALTMTSSTAGDYRAIVYCITNYSGVPASISTIPPVSDAVSPTPPALTTPWPEANTLWFAAITWNFATSQAMIGTPANYTNVQYQTPTPNASHSAVCVVQRERRAETEDPGFFTLSAASNPRARTVAVAGRSAGAWRSRSLRFSSIDSARLNRTFAGTFTDQKKGTIKVSIKRTLFGAYGGTSWNVIAAGYDGSSSVSFTYGFEIPTNGGALAVNFGSGAVLQLKTAALLRDPAAWYHIVLWWDTAQATPANRAGIEINGVPQVCTGSYPAQNELVQWALNNANNQIGQLWNVGATTYGFDGYMYEFIYVDGAKKASADFGELDPTTGVWREKAYTGSYGNKGFNLNFANYTTATAADIGKDSSGMSNLLTYSDDFSNAYWGKVGSANYTVGQADPFGGTGAYLLAGTTPPIQPGFAGGAVSIANGETWTATVYAKAGAGSVLQINLHIPQGGFGYFNLAAGTAHPRNYGTISNTRAAIEDAGGGWWKCSLTVTVDATTSNSAVFYIAKGVDDGNVTGGETIYLYRADLTRGSTVPRELQYTAGAAVSDKNWTPVNFNTAWGINSDSVTDVPIASGVDTGAGGEIYSNYATFSAIDAGSVACFDGGLRIQGGVSSVWHSTRSTMAVPGTGHWWMEFDCTNVPEPGYIMLGISDMAYGRPPGYPGDAASGTSSFAYYMYNGQLYYNGAATAFGAACRTGDQVGIRIDNGSIYFYRRAAGAGAWVLQGGGAAKTGWTGNLAICAAFYDGWHVIANFGQKPWATTLPAAGAKAWCTQNLPTPAIIKPSQYFDTQLRTNTVTGAYSVTGKQFQPDLVWAKARTPAGIYWYLYDSQRGVQKELNHPGTSAEITNTDGVRSFTADGYTAGATMGISGQTWVDYLFKKDPVSGFDVVTYTGNGTAGRTVAHSLGVQPKLIIVKRRDVAGNDWNVWAKPVADTWGASYCLVLNTTAGAASNPPVWNSTAPTAAVFTVGTAGGTNAAGGTYVAYLFAEVPGFSRIDKYTGNGAAEGPFVWCGFRPKWVLFKSGNAVNWFVRDTARNPSNPTNYSLYPNLADAEYTAATAVDLLSNGFKVRDGSAGTNGSGENIIYAAFADTPFKTARAR